MLKMRRQTTVLCHGRPSIVQNTNRTFPHIHHRFDSQHHSRLQPRTLARLSIVRHLRFFMKLPTDAMTDVLPPTGGRAPEARLLVVDDEPNIVELLSASLRFAGFEVVTATTGNDAVKAAERHRPDLVLLDVMLPDVDGFVVLRRLRATRDPLPLSG